MKAPFDAFAHGHGQVRLAQEPGLALGEVLVAEEEPGDLVQALFGELQLVVLLAVPRNWSELQHVYNGNEMNVRLSLRFNMQHAQESIARKNAEENQEEPEQAEGFGLPFLPASFPLRS